MAGGDRQEDEVHQSKKSSKQKESIIKLAWFATGCNHRALYETK